MREENPWAPPPWMGEASPAPAGAEVETTIEEPFTLPVQEVPRDMWQRTLPPRPQNQARAPQRRPFRLAVALPVMVLFALLSAFFSWVSAEPLWLTVGHGQAQTATVTRCLGDGMSLRCFGDVEGSKVSILGVTQALAAGERVAVRMVNEHSPRAYAGGLGSRWAIGLVMVLLCGLGIVLGTGVLRLPDRRERLFALGTSFAAPFLVTVGFLAATF